MRTVLAVVIGIMVIGLTATTSLAIKNTSGTGTVWGKSSWLIREHVSESSRRMRTTGRGACSITTTDMGGFMGVESQLYDLSGPPRGGAFFGGYFTLTVSLDHGNGVEPIIYPDQFTSVDVPWRRDPGDNGYRVSLSNRSMVLTDSIGIRMGDLVNTMTGSEFITTTHSLPLKRRLRAATPIGGEIIPTALRTSGSLSVDRRTANKYRGRLTIRYSGTVSGGPNSGASVRGIVSLRSKGERGLHSTKR